MVWQNKENLEHLAVDCGRDIFKRNREKGLSEEEIVDGFLKFLSLVKHGSVYYGPLIGTIIPFIIAGREDSKELIEIIDLSKPRETAKELAKRKIAEGVSLAEIGGEAVARLVDYLGGNVVSNYSGNMYSTDRGDFKADYVDISNYKKFFPEKYDFTVSNELILPGAGLYGSQDVAEIIGVFANLTKQGGYSIHCPFNLRINPWDYLEYMGLSGVGFWPWPEKKIKAPKIYKKVDPKPELYKDGIKYSENIIFVNKDKEIEIKPRL